MARDFATVLWIGFLHAHLSDEQLERDVRAFLRTHAPAHTAGLKVQIVQGTFKKAHAVLAQPITRELVHRLNKLPFVENGTQRTVCVEDSHGSPGQRCPKWIAGYCRGQNLRFTHPCFCSHPQRETEGSRFQLRAVALESAKGNEIKSKFMASAPFHDGHPRVVEIKAIVNRALERCHENYRRFLATKHREEPNARELYHGTNNNILDELYTHGLQPPSDTNASEACPVSGGKGLSTTLCSNTCPHCTERHRWDRCHMYGLGIYLADLAQKSHRYSSQPTLVRGRRRFRIVVCSVLGRAFTVEGHLRCKEAMHDVVTVRALQEEELNEMIEPCCPPCGEAASWGVGAEIRGAHGDVWGQVVEDEGSCWRLDSGRIAKKETEGLRWNWGPARCPATAAASTEEIAEKSDLLFVQGLGVERVRPGFSVVNSEYIAFHPHQCLPKYEITYEL